MPLTLQQKQALKADIIAATDPECVALEADPTNSDKAFAVAALYNLTASPDYWVWRTRVTKDEITNQTSQDGTNFTWAGNGYITRSAGEQSCWQQIFNGSNSVNPSLANVRQAFTDIFSGTGNAASNRTHLLVVARRKATRLEKLFAIDTPGSGGTRGTTADPDTLVVEGAISYDDVLQAMKS